MQDVPFSFTVPPALIARSACNDNRHTKHQHTMTRVHLQAERAEHEAAKRQTTYYEQVRDHVERLGECSTSDAQGIIGAWEMRNGNTDPMEDVNMDKAEDAGTTPENLARTILNLQTL